MMPLSLTCHQAQSGATVTLLAFQGEEESVNAVRDASATVLYPGYSNITPDCHSSTPSLPLTLRVVNKDEAPENQSQRHHTQHEFRAFSIGPVNTLVPSNRTEESAVSL